MERKIELRVEVDIEKIAAESESRRDAFRRLNRELEMESRRIGMELEDQFKKLATDLKLALEEAF